MEYSTRLSGDHGIYSIPNTAERRQTNNGRSESPEAKSPSLAYRRASRTTQSSRMSTAHEHDPEWRETRERPSACSQDEQAGSRREWQRGVLVASELRSPRRTRPQACVIPLMHAQVALQQPVDMRPTAISSRGAFAPWRAQKPPNGFDLALCDLRREIGARE